MASTGRGGRFPSDDWGTTYKIDVDFNDIATGDITATLDILYDGDDAGAGQFEGPDFGLRSPDNLEWAKDGFIYLQEDRSTKNATFGGESGEEASIWRLDPNSSDLVRVAQINRSAVPEGQTDGDPTDLGDWESSGITDVSTLFGEEPGDLFLFDVQAHSIRDGIIEDANLVQGGQLAFLEAGESDAVEDLIITSEEGENTAEMIDLRGFSGDVTAEYTISREADFNNEVYFYAVDSITGEIDGVTVDQDSYLAAALNSIVNVNNEAFATEDDTTVSGTIEFESGSIIAPMIIVDGTLEQAINGEATVYLPYSGAASGDGFDHIRTLNGNTFGFEDLANGGDQDFNDIVIEINNFTV